MRSLPKARPNSISQCYDSVFCNNHFRSRALLSLLLLWAITVAPVLADGPSISGKLTDPQGSAVPNATVTLVAEDGKIVQQRSTNTDGQFAFQNVLPGKYALKLMVPGFDPVTQPIVVRDAESLTINLQLKLAAAKQEVRVSTDVLDVNVASPDPAQRLLIREETLDANPGRPGAPVSIPGLPIETASGGIKAPQYFAPGVAGDHGEPIAQFFQIGNFLYPNNLPANAHGNGYSDPNVLISPVIEGVTVDGGAFNVREGNHSIDLAATYVPRQRFSDFVQLTGDYRDIDLMAGWSPVNPQTDAWIAGEFSFGNGLLDRLEHRQQYKVNGEREFKLGNNELTLFGIGYYGFSDVPGLIPISILVPGETIDNRQSDTTHNFLVVATDNWKWSEQKQFSFSGFLRNYTLELRSNFGDGLIQQSETRNVFGGEAAYIQSVRPWISLLAGVDVRRDAPRNLDLDHIEDNGIFQPVTSNNLTLSFVE